ncbi:MAG: thiamine pyrophosphate-dependent enzyme [Anaerolineae bacterium]
MMTTYRNERPYGFCPGCSHRLVLDALDRALVRLQWPLTDVVLVTDIGCVGLSDQYFRTSGFHGLHGRSLTYATGIKLARPDLHVIALIGDGGCGIGFTHLVNAARRNIGVTTLVFNNLNFGMTGGEHSVTTPIGKRTATTPWGNTERPLDIAQTVAVNGASYVWRGTAFEPDLDEQIETALTHNGFALLDIWELCVAYYASVNRVNPKQLKATMSELDLQEGVICRSDRVEGTQALQEGWASLRDAPAALSNALEVQYSSELDRAFSVVIGGAAGAHVRTAGHLLTTAATMSGLWTTQRDEYGVTVRSGHSISEVILSPEPIQYTGITEADVIFLFSEEAVAKTTARLGGSGRGQTLFVMQDLVPLLPDDVMKKSEVRVLAADRLRGVARSSITLALVAAAAVHQGFLSPESLITSAGRLNPAYAEANQDAVRKALASLDALFP